MAALYASVAQAWPSPDGAIDSEDWCGPSPTKDWACARVGASSADATALPSRGFRRLHPYSAVWAAQGGEARVSLRNQARCTIGGGRSASEVIARPRSGILLRQRQGDSVCSTPHRRLPIELCAEDDCIGLLRAEGTAVTSVFAPEVTASFTETSYRRIRIVSCSGSISVDAGGQNASGGARGRNRYVIEVVETTTRSESQGGTATVESTNGGATTIVTAEGGSAAGGSSAIEVIEIGELSGRGPCAASSVREGERWVEA